MRLGVIEGFYGPLWSWTARSALVWRLAPIGYAFYHYGPKADPHVRKHWTRPWPDAEAARLRAFAADCRAAGVRFGVVLTPLSLSRQSTRDAWDAFAQRLRQIDGIGADDLVLAFDDDCGGLPNLAGEQARIVHWAAARTAATQVYVCPTYYSDDPVLDRLFGPRPATYLADLGATLDPAVHIYWAGEEICPRAITSGHVARVAETLRRAPVLWDNYPVNDSPRMALHLHLRAFTGRSARLAQVTVGHAINPALQPTLTGIPAMTLPAVYARGDDYAYMAAFHKAATAVLGPDLARQVAADLPLLCDAGRDRLSTDTLADLRARYGAVDHPAAQEIVAWLNGRDDPTAAAPEG